MIDDDFLDGNELAGPLRELFAMDVTAAHGKCAHCGLVGPIAQAHLYARSPGLVARCPGCTEVLLRLVRSPDRAWLDLRGVTYLEIALGPS